MLGKNAVQSLWSSSYGITSNQQIPLFFSGTPVKKIRFASTAGSKDSVIGWGNKANTQSAIRFSAEQNLTYMRLEDGFFGYLGHPSVDKMRLSL